MKLSSIEEVDELKDLMETIKIHLIHAQKEPIEWGENPLINYEHSADN